LRRLPASLWIWTVVLGGAVALAQPGSGKAPAAPPPPSESPTPAVAPKHFAHTDHKARGVDVEKCASCHSIDATGQVLAPAAQGHAPCLDAKCHATDFLAVGQKARTANPAQFARSAAFCLGCHQEVPWPWKKPTTRVLKAYEGSREHHVEMNHFDHTVRAKQNCRGCHAVDDKSFELVVGAPGHAQCGTCHNARTSPPVFAMKECNACHLRESRAAYLQRKDLVKSRPDTDVRACDSEGHEQLEKKLGRKVKCFKHETSAHRTQSGAPVQCVYCHFVVGDKTQWGKNRDYRSLDHLRANPIIWNARDKQHESCGRSSACHKKDVDPVSGANCGLCHAEKSVF
jgi:hypothetical protein